MKELIQQHIGSGPILKALIQSIGLIPIIDRRLPADPRRVGPPHGEAVAGMVACLIQGICALYRIEQVAVEDPVLRTLFPHYDAKAWHDDHLGDTLVAIWEFGPGALQGAATAHLLDSFCIRVDQIHYNTTSFKVVGRYEAADETAAAEESGKMFPRTTQPQPVRLCDWCRGIARTTGPI